MPPHGRRVLPTHDRETQLLREGTDDLVYDCHPYLLVNVHISEQLNIGCPLVNRVEANTARQECFIMIETILHGSPEVGKA